MSLNFVPMKNEGIKEAADFKQRILASDISNHCMRASLNNGFVCISVLKI
jgi:hypothetical protein